MCLYLPSVHCVLYWLGFLNEYRTGIFLIPIYQGLRSTYSLETVVFDQNEGIFLKQIYYSITVNNKGDTSTETILQITLYKN